MSPRLSSPIPARSTLLGLAPLPLLLSSRSRLSSPAPANHPRTDRRLSITGGRRRRRARADRVCAAYVREGTIDPGDRAPSPHSITQCLSLSRKPAAFVPLRGSGAIPRLYLPVRASRPWRLQLHAGVVDVTRVCLLLKPPWASRRNESRHCPRTPCDREREVCGPPLTPNADIPPSLAVTGMIDTTHDRFVGADTLSRPRTHLTARAASPWLHSTLPAAHPPLVPWGSSGRGKNARAWVSTASPKLNPVARTTPALAQ